MDNLKYILKFIFEISTSQIKLLEYIPRIIIIIMIIIIIAIIIIIITKIIIIIIINVVNRMEFLENPNTFCYRVHVKLTSSVLTVSIHNHLHPLAEYHKWNQFSQKCHV